MSHGLAAAMVSMRRHRCFGGSGTASAGRIGPCLMFLPFELDQLWTNFGLKEGKVKNNEK